MMTAFSTLLFLQTALAGADPTAYEIAYDNAQNSGKPLVVLIGTDWCPACQTMKQHTMANMARSGKLGKVEYAHIDADQQSTLARAMMNGTLIPQLVVFAETPTGWKKFHAMGAQSEAQVQSMIDAAISAQKRTALTATSSAQ